MKKQLLGLVAASALAASAYAVAVASNVAVKDSAPERYTVKKGDTLWDISGRYLSDPWRWPEIWAANRQIDNPHLIFPGDVLLLCSIKGQAMVVVDQGGGCAEAESRIAAGTQPAEQKVTGSGRDFKLHPQVREQDLALAIPAIPLQAIQRYLNDSRVVTPDELQKAPYVMAGADERLVVGAGSKVYVRGKGMDADGSYGVYRGGVRYDDPESGEVLGYEATAIGSGRMIALSGGVGTFEVTRTIDQEVRIEDKLLPHEERAVSSVFVPRNPDGVKPGRILRIFGSIGGGANYSVIVLNRGEREGVRQGDTFALYQRGKVIRDRVSNEYVKLPSEHVGLAMVFRTFNKVSYALVLRASSVVKVGDEVRPPISGD